jgi:hypothetical protein
MARALRSWAISQCGRPSSARGGVDSQTEGRWISGVSGYWASCGEVPGHRSPICTLESMWRCAAIISIPLKAKFGQPGEVRAGTTGVQRVDCLMTRL